MLSSPTQGCTPHLPMHGVMRRDTHKPRLLRATLVGLLLFAVSTGLLAFADEALDVTAVVGGIGVVMSGALLGLTLLVARWSGASSAYVATEVPGGEEFEPAAFDDPSMQPPIDGAAAV